MGSRFWLIVVGAVALVALGAWLATPGEPKLTSVQERALRATGMGRGSLGPKTQEALDLVEALTDLHVAGDIRNGTVAQEITCATAARSAFDTETGTPRYRMYRWESGRIQCFRSGNFHPVTGAPLLPLTREHVGAILDPRNSQLYPPEQGGLWDLPQSRPAPPTPAPVRPAAPAAIPDLSEGPCCPPGR